MLKDTRPNFILKFAVGVSLFGLFTVLTLAMYPPTIEGNVLWRKSLVGSVFSLICLVGIMAASLPRQCSRVSHFRRGRKNSAAQMASAVLRGHHPDCERFSAHVVHIDNHTLCAACTGLFLGAVLALIGTGFYFFDGWRIDKMGLPTVLIGIVGVILGFLQLKLKGSVRLVSNILFVLGAFLVLIGVDELTQSLSIDLFLIALTLFWLFTRIILSQWDHWRTCHNCKSPCEIRRLKKS